MVHRFIWGKIGFFECFFIRNVMLFDNKRSINNSFYFTRDGCREIYLKRAFNITIFFEYVERFNWIFQFSWLEFLILLKRFHFGHCIFGSQILHQFVTHKNTNTNAVDLILSNFFGWRHTPMKLRKIVNNIKDYPFVKNESVIPIHSDFTPPWIW